MNRSILTLLILALLITGLTVNWGRSIQACSASGGAAVTYLTDANDPNEPEPDPNTPDPEPETVFTAAQVQ